MMCGQRTVGFAKQSYAPFLPELRIRKSLRAFSQTVRRYDAARYISLIREATTICNEKVNLKKVCKEKRLAIFTH